MKCVTCGHSQRSHTAISRFEDACVAKMGTGLERCPCVKYAVEVTPLKPRKDDPDKRRFAAQRNKPYTDWVSAKPCYIGNRDCWQPFELIQVGRLSDPAHVNETRAQGAPDEGEVVHLCRFHHRQQEGKTAEFNKAYGVDLPAVALALWVAFEKETGVAVL